jgi:hypothetical protein
LQYRNNILSKRRGEAPVTFPGPRLADLGGTGRGKEERVGRIQPEFVIIIAHMFYLGKLDF